MSEKDNHPIRFKQPVEDGPWRITEVQNIEVKRVAAVHVYDTDDKTPWRETYSPPVFFNRDPAFHWEISVDPDIQPDPASRAVFGVKNASGVYPKWLAGPAVPESTSQGLGFHALGFYKIETSLGQTGYLEVKKVFLSSDRKEIFHINPFHGLSWPKRGTVTDPVTWKVSACDEPNLDEFPFQVKFEFSAVE